MRVRLVHWNADEGRECQRRLAAQGFEVAFDACDEPSLMRIIRDTTADAFVIDLSRLPSHGRQAAMSIRSSKSTRAIPIVFVDGDPEKVARLKTLLPDAVYTTWPRVKTALARAISSPPKSPIVPPSSIYTGRPTADKLGFKEGMRVAMLGAPKGFAGTLEPLPAKVKLTAKADDAIDLALCFVRSRRELSAQIAALSRAIDRQTVWIAWPKQASGVKSDLNGNVVRETGLASGWVDFKICSIDDTWSGLAFKRRR